MIQYNEAIFQKLKKLLMNHERFNKKFSAFNHKLVFNDFVRERLNHWRGAFQL